MRGWNPFVDSKQTFTEASPIKDIDTSIQYGGLHFPLDDVTSAVQQSQSIFWSLY